MYVGHYMLGLQVWRYSLMEDGTAFTLTFSVPLRPDIAHDDADAYRALLQQAFADAGWEGPTILDAMRECKDLYFNSVSQIRMNRWSQGRVALTGDANFAPSLLSGQGSAFAMAGAYLLAGELKAANGDHEIAFGKYQTRFKPFIDAQQEAAVRTIRWYAPKRQLDLWLRNTAIRLIALPFVSTQIGKRFVDIRFELPAYSD